MFLYVFKETFRKLYITRQFLGLRMRNFQDINFIWTRTCREIFKYALVYLWALCILFILTSQLMANFKTTKNIFNFFLIALTRLLHKVSRNKCIFVFPKILLTNKSARVNTSQHESTEVHHASIRVWYNSIRINTNLKRVNTSLTWVNTNQKESKTGLNQALLKF